MALKGSERARRLSPKWIWGLWLCLASLAEQQKVFLDRKKWPQADECDMAPRLQPGRLSHALRCVGGRPEATAVPVGCQAVGLVKYHLRWIEPAPFGLSGDSAC